MSDNNGYLRYLGLGLYSGLAALFVALDKLDISDPTVAAAVLAPIALVITADIYKHKSD